MRSPIPVRGPAATTPRVNPYVGPRAFTRKDTIYGRDLEAAQLCDLLISERIVVLHAPSGAGKTSLVQAGAVPILEDENFTVTEPLRVSTPDENAHNSYVHSVNLSLLGEERAAAWGPRLASASLGEVLDYVDEQDAARGRAPDRVLFFDQFEEVLILNTADYDGRAEFFSQLAQALRNPRRWALLAIREDFLGRLDTFRPRLPTHLRASMRLDYLERPAAHRAMIGPTPKGTFTEAAADCIFDRLAKIRAVVDGQSKQVPSHNVEPVQLQAICHQLWRSLLADRDRRATIDVDDVKRVSFDTHLAQFYEDALAEVAEQTGATERAMRTWIDTKLITADGWRRQTRTPPITPDVSPDLVIGALEDHYLINRDLRGGAFWYELTHDRIVKPVRKSNSRWFTQRLDPVQHAAKAWLLSGRDDTSLLQTRLELAGAKKWLDQHDDPEVADFVKCSQDAIANRNRFRQIATMNAILYTVVILEALLIIVLGAKLQ